MASTGFWPIKSRLKDVIDYAENPDKTIDKRFMDDDLWATLRYAENNTTIHRKINFFAKNLIFICNQMALKKSPSL